MNPGRREFIPPWLMGRVTEDELRAALTVRTRRRVRRDTTISVDGVVYEVPLGYLAGQVITVATSLFDSDQPMLELDGKRIALSVVDPARERLGTSLSCVKAQRRLVKRLAHLRFLADALDRGELGYRERSFANVTLHLRVHASTARDFRPAPGAISRSRAGCRDAEGRQQKHEPENHQAVPSATAYSTGTRFPQIPRARFAPGRYTRRA